VIRFVRNDPPAAGDFRSYADDGKPVADACQACALSVLRRDEDVPIARKAMPWFKKQLVAKAVLTSAHGVIRQTGAHRFHCSFWVEASHGGSIHSLFRAVSQ
jgi:hypothetical protein